MKTINISQLEEKALNRVCEETGLTIDGLFSSESRMAIVDHYLNQLVNAMVKKGYTVLQA